VRWRKRNSQAHIAASRGNQRLGQSVPGLKELQRAITLGERIEGLNTVDDKVGVNVWIVRAGHSHETGPDLNQRTRNRPRPAFAYVP
jgi:hypothetical protein